MDAEAASAAMRPTQPRPTSTARLIGLAAAVIAGIGLLALVKYRRIGSSGEALDLTQLTTEACFYLGALASWRFI